MAQPRPLETPGRPRRGSLPSGAAWQAQPPAPPAGKDAAFQEGS
ncbi:hypothetical protein J1605_000927 [Eschrichtius robustus]|uniref:Uncharacterized protein n=1 Tax=Eschrichtius robustus TaxID=9764 RepID=A0AB34GMX3_ESCRO|nr:hypothetical protein J1605_000927 [Eschrichtius robustus]